ncbi:MAG TPA: DUF5916 domain-containing protein [Blastocatellia bacterium]|nr:DUF5916 domain-containing protein [Blastocatellia bacterium]
MLFKFGIRVFAAIIALCLTSVATLAQSSTSLSPSPTPRPSPPTATIPRVSVPPKIEDYLSGGALPQALKITEFFQREPQDGAPATLPTTAYLSYDDKNLYVIFVCKDDPAKVRAHLTKREAIFNDDVVGVLLDTFHDRQRGYEFIVNPLGIQMDGIASEGQDDDFSFDTLWHSEGRLTEDGFIVRIALPFKSLRFSNAPTQEWGIALARITARTNEQSFWPHISRQIQGFAQQMATLEGLENISPGRNIQLIPYGFVARSRFLDTQVPAFRTDNDLRMGLDAKVVLKDALTLDVTLNPDFSQVESDEPQVTINQRFEVFFPEKRPFFLENAGFFQTPENLFFSRRIADPQFGARLTGKLGHWALGAIAMDDRAPGHRFAEDSPFHGNRAGIGVFRLKREFGDQSSAGVLVTSRDFGSSSNRVASFDTRLKLNDHWVATGQAIASRTRLLDGEHLNGSAFYGEINYQDRHLYYSSWYTDRSPTFRAELGFIPRVDIRNFQNFARYQWRPKKGPVQSFGPSGFAMINYDRRGRVQDWETNGEFRVGFNNTTFISALRSQSFELFNDIGFHKSKTSLVFETSWLKWLSVSASYQGGKGINFFPAAGLDPFLANTTQSQLGLTLRPSSQLTIEQTYIYSRLRTRGDSNVQTIPRDASIFNNHLYRAKVNYQFTRELSLRAILDYDALLANQSLISAERSKRLNLDFLVTYFVNPGTALYVGYSNGFENLALTQTLPPVLQRTLSPTTVTGRQFFVKMSYLLRF